MRYPLPIPASYEHRYTLPAGTELLVGTVAPNNGQAGGGVEVQTIDNVKVAFLPPPNRMGDY